MRHRDFVEAPNVYYIFEDNKLMINSNIGCFILKIELISAKLTQVQGKRT
jgi:hypothetical protein